MPEETQVQSIAASAGDATEQTGETQTPETPEAREPRDEPRTFRIGDQDMTFEQVQEHVKDLEQYRDFGRTMVHGTDDPVKSEHATRFLLADAGYTPAQIETYLQAAREGLEGGGEELTETPKTETPENLGETLDPRDEQIKELRAELQSMRESQASQRTDMLRRSMEQTLEHTIKNHPGVVKILNTARTLNGEEGMSGRVDRLKGTIERQLLDNLKRRVNRGEQFSVSWLDEEASKAAETVVDSYRSVIGDPDKLQRAPETAAEEEGFVNKEPVKPLVPDPSEPIADATARAEKYTLDTLTELEREARTSGGTKA